MAWLTLEDLAKYDDSEIFLTCPRCHCVSTLDEWAVIGVPDGFLACPTCDDMTGNTFIPKDEIKVEIRPAEGSGHA